MKIPLYKRQIERSAKPAGLVSNLSVNTAAWMAPGQAVAKVGDAVQKWGYEKAEMEAKTEAQNALRELRSNLDNDFRKQIQNVNPFKAKHQIDGVGPRMGLFQQSYNRILKSKALSSTRAQNLFRSQGDTLWRTKLASFRTQNDKRITEYRKNAMTLSVTDEVATVTNITASYQERLQSFLKLNGTTFRGRKVPGMYDTAEAQLLFNAKTLKIRREKINEDLFMGIAGQLLQNQKNPIDVLEDFKGFIKQDTFLQRVAGKLPAAKLEDLKYKLFTRAKNIDKEKERASKQKETAVNETIEKDYQLLWNLDNSAENIEKKRDIIANLRRLNWPNAQQNKIIESVEDELNANDENRSVFKSTDEGSVMGVMSLIRNFAMNDKLTWENLQDAKKNLTEADYSKALQIFRTERTDSQKINLDLFQSKFQKVAKIDKLLGEGVPILGDAPNVAFNEAKEKFLIYLRTNPLAGFKEINTEADKITKQAFKTFKMAIQPELDDWVRQNKKKYDIQNLGDDPEGNFKRYIQSRKYELLPPQAKKRVKNRLRDLQILLKFMRIAEQGGVE